MIISISLKLEPEVVTYTCICNESLIYLGLKQKNLMKITKRIKFHAELWLSWQPIGKSLKKKHKKSTACQISK